MNFDNESFPISSRAFSLYSNRFWRLLLNSGLGRNETSITIKAKVKRSSLIDFVQACHNQEYSITRTNVHDLRLLCCEWEVDSVLELANNFIKNPLNLHDLLIPSILLCVEHAEETSDFESSVAAHFAEFIDNDSIFELPLQIVDRIFSQIREENRGDALSGDLDDLPLDIRELVRLLEHEALRPFLAHLTCLLSPDSCLDLSEHVRPQFRFAFRLQQLRCNFKGRLLHATPGGRMPTALDKRLVPGVKHP
jgi:hypothetical protein